MRRRVPKARGSVADRGAVRPPASFATLAAVTLAVAMFGGCGPASRTPAGRPASSGAAASVSPAGQPSRPPSPSSTPTAAPTASTPTPIPVPAPPLEAVDSGGAAALYGISGAELASLPSADLYTVASPLGGSLLAEHSGSGGVDELAAIGADGTVGELATVGPDQFRDAIGSPDGGEWAWMVDGPTGCGPTSAAGGATDVYVSSVARGAGTKVALLDPLSGDVPWSFFRWTAAGIVLREGPLPCGASDGPSFNDAATDLLDPSTGAVTSLGSRLGPGCALQDAAESGTMICAPPSTLEGTTLTASSLLLRVVGPDGSRHDLQVGTLGAGCADAEFGDVSVSGDGRYASLSRWCMSGTTGEKITLWIVDTQTLSLTEVATPANLQAADWLPGSDTLLAVAHARWQGTLAPSVSGTYTVTAAGTATRITPAVLIAASVAHP